MSALDDARLVVQHRPHWSKGYLRLGVAYELLGNVEKAIDSFRSGAELDPGSDALSHRLESLLAWKKDQNVGYSAGLGAVGQLGIDLTARNSDLNRVPEPRAVVGVKVVTGGLGAEHTVLVTTDGRAMFCGDGRKTVRALEAFGTGPAGAAVWAAAGRGHSLVVTENGGVWAFGASKHGGLGLGEGVTVASSPAPVVLPAGCQGPAEIVACGRGHSVIVLRDGVVLAMGSNGHGQLGLGDQVARWVPVRVSLPGGARARSAACGDDFTLILAEDGAVFACGKNTHGQLGTGSNNASEIMLEPVAALTGTPVVAVAAGSAHSVLLTATGLVYVCGLGASGQLGLGDTGDRAFPCLVVSLSDHIVVAVAAGLGHTLVATSGGRAFAFGDNRFGQLASAEPALISDVPLEVEALRGVNIAKVAAGSFHSLFVSEPRTLVAPEALLDVKAAVIGNLKGLAHQAVHTGPTLAEATDAAVEGKVVLRASRPESATVHVSWSDPAESGGYTVAYRHDQRSSWFTAYTSSQRLQLSLFPGPWTFKVRVTDLSLGIVGPWSASATIMVSEDATLDMSVMNTSSSITMAGSVAVVAPGAAAAAAASANTAAGTTSLSSSPSRRPPTNPQQVRMTSPAPSSSPSPPSSPLPNMSPVSSVQGAGPIPAEPLEARASAIATTPPAPSNLHQPQSQRPALAPRLSSRTDALVIIPEASPSPAPSASSSSLSSPAPQSPRAAGQTSVVVAPPKSSPPSKAVGSPGPVATPVAAARTDSTPPPMSPGNILWSVESHLSRAPGKNVSLCRRVADNGVVLRAVLKRCSDIPAVTREVEVLKALAGTGYVPIMLGGQSAPEAGIVVMEVLGTPLSSLHSLPVADAVCAAVESLAALGALHLSGRHHGHLAADAFVLADPARSSFDNLGFRFVDSVKIVGLGGSGGSVAGDLHSWATAVLPGLSSDHDFVALIDKVRAFLATIGDKVQSQLIVQSIHKELMAILTDAYRKTQQKK